MNILLDNLERLYKKQPEKPVLEYSCDDYVMNYADLDEYTGKIHAYLKKEGIGREDVVLIHMQRSIKIIAAMIGIWRAGAACIVCENSMAPDRVRFIAADSNTRFIISDSNISEIEACEPIDGCEDVNDHDIAYFVYTSGSTGKPKGVIHEFGNINQSIAAKKYDGVPLISEDEVLAVNSPLNFVAAVDYIVNVLAVGGTALLMDVNDVKNPIRRIEVYEERNVTATFMTPSLYKSCQKLNSQMRWILLGGEPCVGIFNGDIKLYNGFNMSEAGRDMCIFLIDKPYELTPIGKNRGGEEMLILRDDGSRADTGEPGELCFANPYIRGYVGLPEKTAAAFKNGIFHSGDIASRGEDGNIRLHGRSDDMIKINGNRIEPVEIEICAKNELCLRDVAVKGFITPSRSFVVLYYFDDVRLDPEKSREVLSAKLSSYMIPSYFVHLDEKPLLPNGKIDKKKLEMPDISSYRNDYAAPVTPLQKKFCELYETVLEQKGIGIDDDFYELGGDSLRSMNLLVKAKESTLSVSDIYRGRTVRKLCEILEGKTDLQDDYIDSMAKSQGILLTDFETYLLDYQLYSPASTLCNMPQLWRMKAEDVDTDRLLNAIAALVENHPVFKTVIRFNDSLQLIKHYDSEMKTPVSVEYVTEEEFAEIRKNLVVPFKMLDSPLHRFHVFKTEGNVYLFMDFNHVFSDGTSLQILEKNLSKAYHGQKLEKDYHYLITKQIYEREHGEEAKRAAEYNASQYDSTEWTRNIKPDHEARGNQAGVVASPIGIPRDKIDAFLKEKNISLNVLNVAAALLTIREKENSSNVMVSWMYNGRETMKHDSCIGLLIKEPPVAVSFDKVKTVDELLSTVKYQTVKGVEMAADSYILRTTSIAENDTFRVRNQGDLRRSTCIEGVPFETLSVPDSKQGAFQMDLQIVENEDQSLESWVVYNNQMVERTTAEGVSEVYNRYYSQIVSGEFKSL